MESKRRQLVQPKELADVIDELRGNVPRNRWINEACLQRARRNGKLKDFVLTQRGKPSETNQ